VDGNTGEETYEEQESQHHGLGEGGYSCELKLKRNALGKGAGRKSDEAKARQNDQEAPHGSKDEPPSMATVHETLARKGVWELISLSRGRGGATGADAREGGGEAWPRSVLRAFRGLAETPGGLARLTLSTLPSTPLRPPRRSKITHNANGVALDIPCPEVLVV